MGSIRRSPRVAGRWEARYRDPYGRQRTKTVDTKADARAFLSRVEVAVMQGDYVAPEGGRKKLSAWLDDWLDTTVNLRPSTRARDVGYLDRYVRPRFGDCRIGAIEPMDVRTWVADLSATGLAPATVVKAHQLLGKSLTAAVDVGLIARSPCGKGYLPKIEQDEIRFLSPAEVGSLADAIHPRYRALVLVGAYAGLRIGELAGLRRSRVDALHGRVDVAEVCVEVAGRVHFGPPKTRAGRRSVTLPRSVASELGEHLTTWGGPELVFTSPEGGPLRTPTWRRRFWAPAVTKAGVDGLTPHGLRHTAVALWIAAGASAKEVAARAGHTSVSFTLDRYGHLYPESDELLRERLDGMIGSVPMPSRPATLAPRSS
jgi:integrase